MSDLARAEGAPPSAPAVLEQAREFLTDLERRGILAEFEVRAINELVARLESAPWKASYEWMREQRDRMRDERDAEREVAARLSRENAEKDVLLAAHRAEFLDECALHGDLEAAQQCLRDFEASNLAAALVGEQAAEPSVDRLDASGCIISTRADFQERFGAAIDPELEATDPVVACSSESDDTRGESA